MLQHLAICLAEKPQVVTRQPSAHRVCLGCRQLTYLADTGKIESFSICIPSIRSVIIFVALVAVGYAAFINRNTSSFISLLPITIPSAWATPWLYWCGLKSLMSRSICSGESVGISSFPKQSSDGLMPIGLSCPCPSRVQALLAQRGVTESQTRWLSVLCFV